MENSVTLGGTPIVIRGKFPEKGQTAPGFSLVAKYLSDVTLEKFAGKRKILNIFPSIDTSTCATSVRKFNQRASEAANTVVLCISADLPFAQSRFCGAEGLNNVITLSTMRGREFLKDYGVETAGDLMSLLVRLEDSFGIVPAADGTGLSLNPKAPHAPKAAMAIQLWAEKRARLENGEIDADEYEDWKASL